PRKDHRFSKCQKKSKEESKALHATDASKSAGRSLCRYQKRILRRAENPLPAATTMPVNRREFLEAPAVAGTLAAVARKSGLKPILLTAFLFALALGVPMASLAAPCGGPGQR